MDKGIYVLISDKGGVLMRRIFAFVVVLVIAFSSVGCGIRKPKTLVSNMNIKEPDVSDITEENAVITDFAVRLFQQSLEEEKNTLIAPVSALSALSLIANGTEGNSLAQIEEIVGLSAEELNEYIYSYTCHLSEKTDEENKLYLANSIWINKDKRLDVYDDFLQANETYYNTSIYNTPFDRKCVDYTNDWISDNTQDLICDVTDEVHEESIMYLVSTLNCDLKWEVRNWDSDYCDFKSIDGTSSWIKRMFNREDFYLKDENAHGFVKNIEGSALAFVVLLPNEGMNIRTYIQNLTGEKLYTLLRSPKREEVDIWMPAFSFSYEVDIKNVLMDMGIVDIFDENLADFSSLGYVPEGGKIQIDNFYHKICIDVDENGINTESMADGNEVMTAMGALNDVYVDRPFIFILMDCENNIPLLMGATVNLE